MVAAPAYTRRGRPKKITLDYEAEALLREMTNGQKTQGRFLSILIHREAARRNAVKELKRTINEVLDGAQSEVHP
jgi:hypothetical protein